MESPLYMMQMEIDLPHLLQQGRRMGLGPNLVDLGYLVHCYLGTLFGDRAPKPFSIRSTAGRRVRLLGYSTHHAGALQDFATSVAEPSTYQAMDWDQMASKALPERWENGASYNFEVCTSPIRRLGSTGRHGRPGAEVDAFLAHCWTQGIAEGADRSEVYRHWLHEEMERLGGASLAGVEVAGFTLERLLRRTQGTERKGRSLTRPIVTFRGRLVVQNPERFRGMLGRGIGRHRAFGLGMLLLRP